MTTSLCQRLTSVLTRNPSNRSSADAFAHSPMYHVAYAVLVLGVPYSAVIVGHPVLRAEHTIARGVSSCPCALASLRCLVYVHFLVIGFRRMAIPRRLHRPGQLNATAAKKVGQPNARVYTWPTWCADLPDSGKLRQRHSRGRPSGRVQSALLHHVRG